MNWRFSENRYSPFFSGNQNGDTACFKQASYEHKLRACARRLRLRHERGAGKRPRCGGGSAEGGGGAIRPFPLRSAAMPICIPNCNLTRKKVLKFGAFIFLLLFRYSIEIFFLLWYNDNHCEISSRAELAGHLEKISALLNDK